ncbi:MAG: tRNA pseudouridine(13) synthase TruD [Gammaproteobacteria bacterium]|nr:MAG: tRNA pseudouridine(13) synthase TruD [Gammaproteobacteria bacterium]
MANDHLDNNAQLQILDKEYAFSRVYPSLNITAKIKQRTEDFVVEEHIAVTFSGEGEHCWVYIKKTGCNTDWLAQQIAKYCGIKKMAVAYAGLKDRHAVTSQWFSVQLPGKPMPDWSKFESSFAVYVSANSASVEIDGGESIQVLKSFRHNKKLQRGALKSNHFKIILRDISDTDDKIFEQLKIRCDVISKEGVPNYFGTQRFGRNGNNLDQALKLFSKSRFKVARQKRSMYLSAARSWMFNYMVSERVDGNVWNRRIPGDVFMLDGKSACFRDDAREVGQLVQRLASNAIHPTAILWGEGDTMVESQSAKLQSRIINQFPAYRDGLVAARLQAMQRACRVVPAALTCCRQADNFIVSFSLPAGSYATMVLAEIFSDLR